MAKSLHDSLHRSAYHVGNVTTRLLSEALVILEEQGFSALNLRDLATATGVAIGTVYYHFDSKAALLEHLAAHGYRELRAELRKGRLTPRHRVVRSCASDFLSFSRRRPALYALMFNPQSLGSARVQEARDNAIGEVAEIVRRSERGEHCSEVELRQVAGAVWACAQGAISLMSADGEEDAGFDDLVGGMQQLFGHCRYPADLVTEDSKRTNSEYAPASHC